MHTVAATVISLGDGPERPRTADSVHVPFTPGRPQAATLYSVEKVKQQQSWARTHGMVFRYPKGAVYVAGAVEAGEAGSLRGGFERLEDGQHCRRRGAKERSSVRQPLRALAGSKERCCWPARRAKRIELSPGTSQSVTLPPGEYEIAAKVSSPNVVPFYGKQAFGANTQYSEKFYIEK